ncbi:hypothetical protein Hanom_Chr00s008029g01739641 [Helianthus anomalus]
MHTTRKRLSLQCVCFLEDISLKKVCVTTFLCRHGIKSSNLFSSSSSKHISSYINPSSTPFSSKSPPPHLPHFHSHRCHLHISLTSPTSTATADTRPTSTATVVNSAIFDFVDCFSSGLSLLNLNSAIFDFMDSCSSDFQEKPPSPSLVDKIQS